MDWQPIETAPQDGQVLMLFDPKGLYNPKDNTFGPAIFTARWGRPGEWYSVPNDGRARGATHWMPLPAFPQ